MAEPGIVPSLPCKCGYSDLGSLAAPYQTDQSPQPMADVRLSEEAVATAVRQRIGKAGINLAGFSGHSLRSGFATSAAQAGVSFWKIRQQTGHASDAMLSRYVKAGQLFEENAAADLL